jgi:hypothetical protein
MDGGIWIIIRGKFCNKEQIIQHKWADKQLNFFEKRSNLLSLSLKTLVYSLERSIYECSEVHPWILSLSRYFIYSKQLFKSYTSKSWNSSFINMQKN